MIRPPRLRDRRHLLPGLAAFAGATAVALFGLYANAGTPAADPEPRDASAPPGGVVRLRVLGVNDFHGHLRPPQRGLGGAAWLAGHLDRATLPGRTIRVHAGDMVGATPIWSGWFHDEPTVEAMNEIGFDVGTLGNHEFDEGGRELLRLLRGGQRTGAEALQRNARGRLVNTSAAGFAGVDFPYVAANTELREGGTVLPPYAVVERAGARVGFIGVTTPRTPIFLTARAAGPYRFTDISDAVNRVVPELQAQGVEAIVVLAHSGAPAVSGDGSSASGEILRETVQMSDAVDAVVAGHSHSVIDTRLPNAGGRGDKLVVEASSFGRAFDRIDLWVDRGSGQVVRKDGWVRPTPHRAARPDRRVTAIVRRYGRVVGPLARRVVGVSDRSLSAADGLGLLAAEGQRRMARADVGIAARGSFRAGVGAGPITYAELYAAQAYDHSVVSVSLGGAEIERLRSRADLFVAAPEALAAQSTYRVAVSELAAKALRMPGLASSASSARPAGGEVEALAAEVSRALGR